MDEFEIKKLLDKLNDAELEAQELEIKKKSMKDAILTDEIKSMLSDIDVEFIGEQELIQETIAELREKIKKAVLEIGGTISGNFKQAVYAKGRVSWETKALDGYAAAHPELNEFRKQGEPSVTIRDLKQS